MRHEEPSKPEPTLVKDRMRAKLEAALTPERLEIEDQSHLHAGHAGWREGGQTHFRIKVASTQFIGKGRLERHRVIYALLAEEIAGGVHALAIETEAPDEG
ncbi:MAG TPA: BolA family protein [Roseiarcus sp.]|nr:BolA family protein [Roseiarcus sp.]